MVVLLLALGTGHDLWRASHPRWNRVVPPKGAEPPGAVAPLPEPEPASSGVPRDQRADSSDRVGRVDLNRATFEQLDGLPGVGPVLATRILEHRRRYGPFRTIDELQAVRGIGPRLMDRLRPHLSVSARPGG